MKNIILIGDSIRMGYQETVKEQLADIAEVWAPEENGGTSTNIIAHLDEWVISKSPDIIHINCGLHDLRKDFNADKTRTTLPKYIDNLQTILTRLQTETDATIIWVQTTPVNEELHHKNKGFDRFEADVDIYNAAAAEISNELNISINDMFSVVQTIGRDNILLDDGVHFTPEGYVLMGKKVAEYIRKIMNNQQ